MHSAQDNFIAHVFHCEPSAGALCKTIEAACKVRIYVVNWEGFTAFCREICEYYSLLTNDEKYQ